ncbi:MAG: KH domain-containing protein [Candidatus Dadabacteria bacterium]|nr:KH domain-containing protein [Candidatus Dadabacteria bacterium]NIQ17053.1 KH domain-containing protein [Candidatus Dadabacteria bacterium]
MPIVIEKEGKTVSEATITACEELGVARDSIDVEVLEEGSKGVLGIGGKNAKVRVTVRDEGFSEKGLKAKKTLEEILNYLVPSQKVNIVETSDRIKLEIKLTEDKGLLIGKGGEMIRALEFIVGKISSKNCTDGREKRIYIDIDGYKNRREVTVSKKVIDAINRVKRTKKPFKLERLSAYERRIAYITLKNERGVKYETVMEGDFKKIVISPDN